MAWLGSMLIADLQRVYYLLIWALKFLYKKTSVMQESDMIPPSYEQANKIMYIFAVDYFYGIFVYFPAQLHRLYKIVTMFCITYTS